MDVLAALIISQALFWGNSIHAQKKPPFIDPKEISDIENIFTRDRKEYLFINYPLDYSASSVLCTGKYTGRLAIVNTPELARFLAEALSETNLYLDVLWVGGKISRGSWYWYDGEQRLQSVSKDVLKLFVNYSKSVLSDDRNCLALAREDHDVPHFPALKCQVQRPFLCERDVRDTNNNGSTHKGWIRLGNRLYKIFREQTSWSEATAKCIMYDQESRLAVVGNLNDVQALGRHLLVGRPSLENAWIGARYNRDHYGFSEERIILPNVTDSHGYPPWRNGTIRKIGGCILLDRHLVDISLYIEARCDRLRSYVCYKKGTKREHDFSSDILIEEFGYRIYFNLLSWEDAKKKCNSYKDKYEGKLAEIREERIVSHLIYVMGENRTTAQHIWLGGMFDPQIEHWIWDSDKTLVDLKILDWLGNNTYYYNVEQYNTCLNMDRENHLKALHYGTDCEYSQNFVCTFPRAKLIELEQDEAQNSTE